MEKDRQALAVRAAGAGILFFFPSEYNLALYFPSPVTGDESAISSDLQVQFSPKPTKSYVNYNAVSWIFEVHTLRPDLYKSIFYILILFCSAVFIPFFHCSAVFIND